MANTSASNADVPPSFVCPLTLEVMSDPVTAADGHSYEHEAIAKWLQSSSLSPLTGQRLQHKHLTRSHALRNAIQEHEQAQARARKRAAARQPSGIKVILLGDSNVGKTSLVHRVKENTFTASASQPTIGCSFCTHVVTAPSGERLTLAIWDTAGQEKYRSFTRQVCTDESTPLPLTCEPAPPLRFMLTLRCSLISVLPRGAGGAAAVRHHVAGVL